MKGRPASITKARRRLRTNKLFLGTDEKSIEAVLAQAQKDSLDGDRARKLLMQQDVEITIA